MRADETSQLTLLGEVAGRDQGNWLGQTRAGSKRSFGGGAISAPGGAASQISRRGNEDGCNSKENWLASCSQALLFPKQTICPLDERQGKVAMHTLKVVSAHSDQALLVKSALYLRLERSSLRAGPTDAPIAEYNDYVWVFGQNYSTEIDITTTCVIRFEGAGAASPRYGPFPAVRLVGPAISFGPRFEGTLARYDREKHQWLACREGKYYEAVVIESV